MGSSSLMLDSIEKKLKGLTRLSSDSCIYRVPENLRKTNEEEYSPTLVSIGPFHHGDPKLIPMEEQKLRYLQALRDQESNMNLSGYIGLIKNNEEMIRGYYAESIKISSDAFIEMVLIDSAFIIVTFLKNNGVHPVELTDKVFSRPFFITQVVRDMKLLENQLPFFILEALYNFVIQPSDPSQYFRTMTFKFFKVEPRTAIHEIKHFVDLLRTCSLPSNLRKPNENKIRKIGFRVSITELVEAGVRFKRIDRHSLLDIEFTDKGVVMIPLLKLQDHTESFFRNLVAYEQCHYCLDSYIIDYVALIDFLINTPKDVETLVDSKIIENWLGNSQEAANLFNNLFKQVNIVSSNFYYSSICDQLETYCNTRCHKYMAMLKHRYFCHPWATISIVSAVILLILSFIQALTGVISVIQGGSSNNSTHHG